MDDLIGKSALLEYLESIDAAYSDINDMEAKSAVILPCKIGDAVWVIRSYKGIKQPKKGIVHEMFFTPDMELMIVVHHVARGRWGKAVFATKADALKAIGERKEK